MTRTNTIKTSTLVAAIALTLAGTAFAQTSSSPSSTQGQSGSSMSSGTSAQPGASGTPSSTAGQQGQAARMNPNEAAETAFRTLDSANRGYITKTETDRISGFSFDKADTNSDGRLSSDEFSKAWSSQGSRSGASAPSSTGAMPGNPPSTPAK